jgi:hypothetical protein
VNKGLESDTTSSTAAAADTDADRPSSTHAGGWSATAGLFVHTHVMGGVVDWWVLVCVCTRHTKGRGGLPAAAAAAAGLTQTDGVWGTHGAPAWGVPRVEGAHWG